MYGSIEEAAKQATTLPTDFGYYGDLDLGGTWGFSGFSVNRDSDALERSNFQVVSEHMQKEHPNDVSIMGASHWAVGWVDQLLVRVYEDDECICTEEDVDDHRKECPEWLSEEHREREITHAFHTIMEFHDSVMDYPALDDTLMSKMEHEELISYLKDAIPFSRVKDSVDLSTNVVEELVAGFLFEHYSVCHVDEVTDSMIEDAMNVITLIFYPVCRECEEQDETGYIAPDGSGRCRLCDVYAEVESYDAALIEYCDEGRFLYRISWPGDEAYRDNYHDAYDYLVEVATTERLEHLNFYSIDRNGNVSDLNEIGFDIDEANQLTF